MTSIPIYDSYRTIVLVPGVLGLLVVCSGCEGCAGLCCRDDGLRCVVAVVDRIGFCQHHPRTCT